MELDKQGSTVQHKELYSIACDRPLWKEYEKEYMCIYIHTHTHIYTHIGGGYRSVTQLCPTLPPME